MCGRLFAPVQESEQRIGHSQVMFYAEIKKQLSDYVVGNENTLITDIIGVEVTKNHVFFSGIGVVCVNEIKKVAKKLFDGVLRHKGQYIDVDENHERTIILWDPEGHQALGDGNITSLSSRLFFFMDALLARSLACLLPSFLPITKCRICGSVEVETGQIATLNCCSSLWAFCVLDIYQSTYVP